MRAFNRDATTVSPLDMMLAIDLVHFLYQAKEGSLRLLKGFHIVERRYYYSVCETKN